MKTWIAIPLLLTVFLLIGCSGGGGGSDNGDSESTTASNDWDQMNWDRGRWQ